MEIRSRHKGRTSRLCRGISGGDGEGGEFLDIRMDHRVRTTACRLESVDQQARSAGCGEAGSCAAAIGGEMADWNEARQLPDRSVVLLKDNKTRRQQAQIIRRRFETYEHS